MSSPLPLRRSGAAISRVAGDAIVDDDGVLATWDPAVAVALQSAIAEAANVWQQPMAKQKFSIPRSSTFEPLELVVPPLPRRESLFGPQGPVAVIIKDREAARLDSTHEIQLLHGITAAETRLVTQLGT